MKYRDIRKYTYHGHSMYPFLQDGDILYFGKVPFSTLRRGDIIVFFSKEHNRSIVSRIIKLSPLTTKGDSFKSSNKEILKRNSFEGKVYTIERRHKLYNINPVHAFILSFLSLYNINPGIMGQFFFTRLFSRIRKKTRSMKISI